tara:strand:- start:143 stop:364 length:222 start_codon:yes stop_codon:yes gene_type:complete
MFDEWSGSLSKWHEQYYDKEAIKERKIKDLKTSIKYLKDDIEELPNCLEKKNIELVDLKEKLNVLLEVVKLKK